MWSLWFIYTHVTLVHDMAVSRDETVVEFNHYTCGYHDYIDVWTPTIGETLYLHCKPDNPKDLLAVAIVTGGNVLVGHVPELFNRQLYFGRLGLHINM